MTAATILLLMVPSFLWRSLYTHGLAGLILLVPATVALSGVLYQVAAMNRARLGVAFKEASEIRNLLQGFWGALFYASVSTILTLPVLGYAILFSAPSQLIVLAGISACCSLLYFIISYWAQAHLEKGFQGAVARRIALTLTTVIFAPLYFWTTWQTTQIPIGFQDLSLIQALHTVDINSGTQIGPMEEIHVLFQWLDTIKLWIIVKLKDTVLIGWLYCLESTLISLVSASFSASTASGVQEIGGQIVRRQYQT